VWYIKYTLQYRQDINVITLAYKQCDTSDIPYNTLLQDINVCTLQYMQYIKGELNPKNKMA